MLQADDIIIAMRESFRLAMTDVMRKEGTEKKKKEEINSGFLYLRENTRTSLEWDDSGSGTLGRVCATDNDTNLSGAATFRALEIRLPLRLSGRDYFFQLTFATELFYFINLALNRHFVESNNKKLD